MGFGPQTHLPQYNPDDHKDDIDLNLFPPSYPNFGVCFEEEVPFEELIQMSMEEHMKMADAICQTYAKNPRFLKLQEDGFQDQSPEEVKDTFSSAAIGNMAFMAYHNPNSFWTKKYQEIMKIVQFD